MELKERLKKIKLLIDELDVMEISDCQTRHILRTLIRSFNRYYILAMARQTSKGRDDCYPTFAEERAWKIFLVVKDFSSVEQFTRNLVFILTSGLTHDQIEDLGLTELVFKR